MPLTTGRAADGNSERCYAWARVALRFYAAVSARSLHGALSVCVPSNLDKATHKILMELD